MRAGDALWNPLTGEKAVLLAGSDDTGGEHLLVDFAVEAGGFVPGGEHVHDHQRETFEVREGVMGLRIDGEERKVGAGETAVVEPGTRHEWWNAGPGEIRITARVEPALDFEAAITALWGLCADGRTDARGRPGPLQGALLAQRFAREIRFTSPPRAVQRVMVPLLARIARWRGYSADFPEYTDLAKHPSARPGLGRLPRGADARPESA